MKLKQSLLLSCLLASLVLNGCSGPSQEPARSDNPTPAQTTAAAAHPKTVVTHDGKPTTAPVTREMREPSDEEKKILDEIAGQMKEDTVDARFKRGQLYLEAGEKGLVAAFPRAVEDFSKILEMEPKNPGALSNRGLAYARSGLLDKAIADYKMLTEAVPDDAYGYTIYASLLAKTGNDKEAISVYDKAVGLGGPAAEGARFNRGNAHIRTGNRELAQKDFEYLAKNAQNPEILKGAKMNLEAMK